eukprot:141611-Pleurochrysis_carterae.AAC.1
MLASSVPSKKAGSPLLHFREHVSLGAGVQLFSYVRTGGILLVFSFIGHYEQVWFQGAPSCATTGAQLARVDVRPASRFLRAFRGHAQLWAAARVAWCRGFRGEAVAAGGMRQMQVRGCVRFNYKSADSQDMPVVTYFDDRKRAFVAKATSPIPQ